MRTSLQRYVLGFSTVLLVGCVACGDSDSPTSPSASGGLLDAGDTGAPGGAGAPGSGGSAGTGVLAVQLTDSPYGAANAVLVTFSDVSVHRSGGGWEPLFDTFAERTCDLKQLENGALDELVGGELPAGHYTQLRLEVVAAALYENPADGAGPCDAAAPIGVAVPVDVPSGTIRLTRQFSIAEGGVTTVLLDFDGDGSIRQIGGGNSSATANENSNGNGNSGNGSGNGNGGNGNNGNGNSDDGDDDALLNGDGEEQLDPEGRYMMRPVIRLVSVDEQEGESSP